MSLNNANDQEGFENMILNLRALKYGRVLLNGVEKKLDNENIKIFVKRMGNVGDAKSEVEYVFLCDSAEEKLKEEIMKFLSMLAEMLPNILKRMSAVISSFLFSQITLKAV